MKIKEKIFLERGGLIKEGPITIVAFGDSVTHGALSYGEINYETAYWNLLKQKISAVRSYMPVNVINAGIGGDVASLALDRMDRHVLSHNPDLVIVCFGLNDVNRPLEEFVSSVGKILERCLEFGCETILMTPNMLNTYVADDTADKHKEYAKVTAEIQNSGRMDLYMTSVAELARKMNVPVCDCYQEWKKLSETCDTTMLLANRINHPKKEMHELFANMLFDIIFDGVEVREQEGDNTM